MGIVSLRDETGGIVLCLIKKSSYNEWDKDWVTAPGQITKLLLHEGSG